MLLPGSLLATDYYVSTTGNDLDNGSITQPWQTIDVSINRLLPGDTLFINDGTYFENVTPGVSGTESAPITIKAVNTGQVIIDGNGADIPTVQLRSVSYIELEGLKLRNAGEATVLSISSPDGQPAFGNTATHHINIRRMSIRGSCIDNNCSGIGIGSANHVLISDSWVYGAGRYALSIYGGRNITVRRVVVRWDLWEGDNYKDGDPRFAMAVYNSHDNIIEDVILLDAGVIPAGRTKGDKGGLKVAGGDNGNTAPFTNDEDNLFTGLMVLNNVGTGINIESRYRAHKRNLFEDVIVMNNSEGSVVIQKKVAATIFDHAALVDNSRGISIFSSERVADTVIRNSLVLNNAGPAYSTDDPANKLTESFNIAFGNSPNYQFNRNPGLQSVVVDPQLEYLFPNMFEPVLANNPGSDGKDRGPSIMKRSYSGCRSNENLWPWMHENLIRNDFCDAVSLQLYGRTGSNSPAWCDSGKTLTDYVWASYSNQSCPNGICNGSPDPVVGFANPPQCRNWSSYWTDLPSAFRSSGGDSESGGGSGGGGAMLSGNPADKAFIGILGLLLLSRAVRKRDSKIV